MRTISNLLNLGGKIYIFIRSESIGKLFRKNAEAEGFSVGNPNNNLYILKDDWTIQGTGSIDHICFQSMTPKMGDGTPIFRVDYGKYLSGAENYLYSKWNYNSKTEV